MPMCYSGYMPNNPATRKKRRRTTLVPVTTMKEIPVLSDRERAELTAALKSAQARVEAGKGIDHEPDTFEQRLVGIYRKGTAAEIVSFWREAGPQKWFEKDEEFDLTIRSRFLAIHDSAARGELAILEDNAQGALALVILLDQFPRNMFRGRARAFAADPLARAVAGRALVRGFDHATDALMRPFFYLPFMHSEMLADQDRCVRLYQALGDAELLRYAVAHRDVIAKFGRFPHRNRVLGRDTTSAEQEFLDGGGFAG
jgi:uncharacterized protein (DUF924 family)